MLTRPDGSTNQKVGCSNHPGRTSEVQVVRPSLRPSSRRWFTVSTPTRSPLRPETVFAVVVERAGHRPYVVVEPSVEIPVLGPVEVQVVDRPARVELRAANQGQSALSSCFAARTAPAASV